MMQTCRVCRGKLEKTATAVQRTVNGQRVTITDVPIEKCVDCGEEWFRARDLKQVERLIARRGDNDTLVFQIAAEEWISKILRDSGLGQVHPENWDRPMTVSDLLEVAGKVRH